MAETLNFARTPLEAVEEAFGKGYKGGVNRDLLAAQAESIFGFKKNGLLTIPRTCLTLMFDSNKATETLATLIAEKNDCLMSHWISDVERQRGLLGFMVETEMGVVNGWLHQPDSENRYTEFNQNRLKVLTKFKELLYEQRTGGGEAVKG